MQNDDQVILLRKCSLWAEISEEEYRELDVVDNYKEVKKGEHVYFEAFHHNNIYFIKKGYIKLGAIDDDGSLVIKDILKPGDFFGQYIFEKNSLNGEFAQAIKSDISLCSFTIEKFVQLLQKHPGLSVRYTKMVGWRIKKFENRLLNVIRKDVKTRLLNFINELLHEYLKSKPLTGDVVEIPNYLTQEEFAQLIGASRQTVASIFSELRDEGIVDYHPKRLLLRQVKMHYMRLRAV